MCMSLALETWLAFHVGPNLRRSLELFGVLNPHRQYLNSLTNFNPSIHFIFTL